jgi:hypothetical protein
MEASSVSSCGQSFRDQVACASQSGNHSPVPDHPKGGSSISEGVAVDREGNVYGAEVGPKDLKKYVKK